MSIRCVIQFLFIFFVVTGSQIGGQTLKLPYKDVGACPFECCTYREWVAKKPAVLLKQTSDKSTKVFTVVKGERVIALTGMVLTTKAGVGKALRNTFLEYNDEKNNTTYQVKIRKGETFSILTYHGEDAYSVWHKGRLLSARFESNIDLFKVSLPKSVWWVKIENRKGQIGWTKAAENFDNLDSCS